MNDSEFLPILVAMLPRTERVYLQLWSLYGMTHEEIAELFECTEDHVEGVLNRALDDYGRLAGRAKRHMADATI